MSATVWKVNGKTLEELRCPSLRITFRNRAADEARLVIDGDLADAAGFAYGQTYAVERGSATVFRGRCEKIVRHGTGAAQSVEIILLGGWHWLTLRMYQQSWPKGASGHGNKSRVILGCGTDGNPIAANAQLADILRSCPEVASGPVAVSASTFPFDEKLDITCAEAIDAVLAWWPDAVVWFDYASGTRLCAARAGALPVRSLDIAVTAEEVQATPRHDLVVPGVRLVYETTSGDGAYQDTVEDTAGTPDAPGGLIQTISVAGSDHNIVSAKITAERLPDTLTPSWWASRIPGLAGWEDVTLGDAPTVTLADAGTSVAPSTLPGGGTTWKPRIGTKTLHSELLSGSVADWMQEAAARVRVTQTASYTLAGQTVEDVILSIDLVLTSAETKVYQRGTTTRPETIPQGLAAEIYAAAGRLYHEGTVAFVGADPPTPAALGDSLLLPELWSGTPSPVQSVAWDVATGTTSISFGPPNHLGVQDLVARCRANRTRGPANHASARLSASTADDGIPLGGATGSVNTSSGGGRPSKITVEKRPGGWGKIELDGSYNNDLPAILVAATVGESADQAGTWRDSSARLAARGGLLLQGDSPAASALLALSSKRSDFGVNGPTLRLSMEKYAIVLSMGPVMGNSVPQHATIAIEDTSGNHATLAVGDDGTSYLQLASGTDQSNVLIKSDGSIDVVDSEGNPTGNAGTISVVTGISLNRDGTVASYTTKDLEFVGILKSIGPAQNHTS